MTRQNISCHLREATYVVHIRSQYGWRANFEVEGSLCTNASNCGKTNTGIRELHTFADINYEFFLLSELPEKFAFWN